MKRTSFVLVSALILSTACRNKNASPGEGAEAPAKTETKAATAKDKGEPKKSKDMPPAPQKNTDLPAPDDVAAAPADAKKSASGLAWKVLTPGKGTVHPTETDRVEVHYSGWTKDGKMFDSSVVRGESTSFALNQVIKGWTEGVQLMTEGAKFRFWIPGDLAYGDKPQRPGAPSGQLTFDVELISIVKPPETPKDVAAPPASATKTASGLAYAVLEQGQGEKPGPTSRVLVHYSGWTKDGKMFDSSVARGRPIPLSVNGVIKGWTEGLQLMAPGAKYRFWIPADLAYGEKPLRPGAPAGQLTFDVELIKIM